MHQQAHAEARCQNRANCTGPGCRLNTGKTERKRNGTGLPLMGHYEAKRLRLDVETAQSTDH